MQMELHGVQFPVEAIGRICARYGVQRLSLFGSILRDDFGPESDVDLLVDFLPSTRIGYIGLANLEAELSEVIRRRVDLRTPLELSKYFRDDVVRGARLLHVA